MAAAPVPTATEAFASDFRGEVLRPDDPGYEAARLVFNGMHQRRPAQIARCGGVADVIAAVNYARDEGLDIAVRGGGHSVQGYSSLDDGLVIDLNPMKGARVDPTKATVAAAAGMTWGELDRETQVHGLAVTGGRISNTGIAGLTLGSGSGWLERSLGLTCDNLVSADLVTADGRLVRASETEEPELFWGLRGAGANFGIVTSLEFRLHPVGPIVLGGMLLFPREKAAGLLRQYRDLMRRAPDEFGGAIAWLTAPPEEFVPEDVRLQPVVAVVVCHTGDFEEGEAPVGELREAGPALDLVMPMPYLVVQQLLDGSAPFGQQGYWKVDTVDEMSDGAMDTIVEHAGRTPMPFSITILEPGGRAIAKTPDADSPIGSRDAEFRYYAVGAWEDPGETEANIGWARDFYAAMEGFSSSGPQVNFVNADEHRLRRVYGDEKYERLVALKDRWDPGNLFRLNANIAPSSG
jgi:FAD binding domain/Berberine and berberine like